MRDSPRSLTLAPIGVIHSPFRERAEAPRQGDVTAGAEGTVALFAGHGYEDALSDLASWNYVWLVFWFDRNQGFQPKVLPPRGERKRGVFATRAPYRPNPIGLCPVRLLGVEQLTLWVRGLDVLDGTPLLDLKPYVPYVDAIADANHGWLKPPARPGAAQAGTAPGGLGPALRAQLASAPDAHRSFVARWSQPPR